MAEPITIKGGSLTIEGTLEFEHVDPSKKKLKYKHPAGRDGSITGVTIDGELHKADKRSEIIIHYELD
jgi:carbon monoxide dehydrogenase subunit G